ICLLACRLWKGGAFLPISRPPHREVLVMSTHEPCTFCLGLPTTTRARSGRLTRCPLCKSTLVECSSGTTHRLLEGASARAGSRGLLLVGVSLASLVVVGWLVAIWLSSSAEPTDFADQPALARAPVAPSARQRERIKAPRKQPVHTDVV